MGGYGSGKKTCRKTTVEECLTLTMKQMVRSGNWCDGQTGTVTWTWRGGGEAKVGFRFEMDTALNRVWLNYVVTDATEDKHSFNFPITLDADPCWFGGRQWYFRCPAEGCGRRTRMLHKPPGAHLFACRSCHNLTYISVQEHDHRVKRFRDDPGAIERALRNGSPNELFLAMKALG